MLDDSQQARRQLRIIATVFAKVHDRTEAEWNVREVNLPPFVCSLQSALGRLFQSEYVPHSKLFFRLVPVIFQLGLNE